MRLCSAVLFGLIVLAAAPINSRAQAFPPTDKPSLYVKPVEDGFETYVAAAIIKKKVPVRLVTREEGADYVLASSAVEVKKVSTGAKVVNCLFLSCGGNSDKGSTSVQLTRGDEIAWSYSVNKGRGEKNKQSLAESIAKHLKSDFFDKGLAR